MNSLKTLIKNYINTNSGACNINALPVHPCTHTCTHTIFANKSCYNAVTSHHINKVTIIVYSFFTSVTGIHYTVTCIVIQ